jgi:predicted esterase
MTDPSVRTIETKHITIDRRVRFATLGKPSDAVREVWFVLHGYSQVAPRFLRYFRTLADETRVIVAPEGLHRYYIDRATRKIGASWMTSEDRLTDIDDYVGYLDRLYTHVFDELGRDSVRVTGLGFSQGVHTLCRWIALGGSRIDRAILWGATVPPDLDLEAHGTRLGAAHLHLVIGEEDEYFRGDAVHVYHERLKAHGIPFTPIPFPGGHRLDKDVLRRLALDDG